MLEILDEFRTDGIISNGILYWLLNIRLNNRFIGSILVWSSGFEIDNWFLITILKFFFIIFFMCYLNFFYNILYK